MNLLKYFLKVYKLAIWIKIHMTYSHSHSWGKSVPPLYS